ncbi:hypothetical protein RCO12_10435 [Staphylococcus coagulans]|uniref:Uncharacterized protein n=1 Tax=Staphylococcus coagulans TaxID=74706 RepID=A0ABU1F1J0_9STAP|nr:hypothetical protein [Staphylococcus coagulans]MDR5603849.1 hypothetical protein [Staphylococcus coagulans]
MRDLSDTVKQRYRINTTGKSPTELQKELRKRGVKGFVVGVNHNRVAMLIDPRDKKRNKECML